MVCSKMCRYKADDKFNESTYVEYVIELNFLSNAVDAYFSTGPSQENEKSNGIRILN